MTKPSSRLKKNIKEEIPPSSFTTKAEYIKWVAALSISFIVYYIVLRLINAYYGPDISGILAYARTVSVPQSGFLPEPKEKLLYLSAVLIFTVSIPAAYYLAVKYADRAKEAVIKTLYPPVLAGSLGLIVFIVFKALAAANPFAANAQNAHDLAAKTNGDFYFMTSFIYGHFYLFLCLLFPAVLSGFFYGRVFSARTRAALEKAESVFVHVFCGTLVAAVFFISAFSFPNTPDNRYDFNAVYYSVVQVYNGLPLLVNGFTNTYGLYPHFVVPFLKISGLSVLSFSALMAFLSSLCFVLLFMFLKKKLESKALLLFGFTTLLFNTFIYPHISTAFDPYFAMCPIRWLFPSLLLFLSDYYLKNRTRKTYFLFYALFALGILWNPDFGMVTYLSLLAFYCYLELDGQDPRAVARKVFSHTVNALLVLASVFAVYSLAIGAAYGSFPYLPGMFSTMKAASVLGSGMLPMPGTYHPWMFISLLYAIGLLYSLRHILDRKISQRSASVFLLTVLGIGLFAYYQGRSHNWNLFPSSFPAFLLLAIFADDLRKTVKTGKVLILPFALAVFFLSFSFFQTIYDYKRTAELVFETNDKEADKAERAEILANAAFIKNLTAEKEKVLIFTRISYQALYYSLSKTAAAVNPGLIDLFFKTDYSRILSFMAENGKTKIFFEPDKFGFFDNKIPAVLSLLYDPQDTGKSNGKIMFLLKKHENKDSAFLLKTDAKDLVHELFDRNFANKLNYALGRKGRVVFGGQFSIELVFRPAVVALPEVTNWQTMLCNSSNDGGFVLQQSGAANNKYIFSFNKRGILVPVVPGKWNYLSIGVNGSRIQAYANGRYVGEADAQKDYSNSEEPLYLGSFKTLGGFFFGDIKELKISNSSLEAGAISSAWNKIEKLPQ